MGLPNKCREGHIHFGSDCPFCLKVRLENEVWVASVNEGDGGEEKHGL